MIIQNHPKYGDHTGTDTYFIRGSTIKEVEEEVSNFITEHKTDENHIQVSYMYNVGPSPINLRPVFECELRIQKGGI